MIYSFNDLIKLTVTMHNADENDIDDGSEADADATPLLFRSSRRRSALARGSAFNGRRLTNHNRAAQKLSTLGVP